MNINDDPPRSAFPTPRGNGFNSPTLPSEASTPFSSNPPEIFRAMSSGSETEGEVSEVNMESVVDEGGRGNRRLAAEAAMRRMGLTRPGVKGKEKEKMVLGPTITETTTAEVKQSKKETYTPYLSPISRATPHPTSDRSPWSKRGSLDNQLPLDREIGGRGGMREGVEERLRTLKRVDDTIWGLVEELTRIRSSMDHDVDVEESEGAVDQT